MELLREVKYLLQLGRSVPDSATSVYAENEVYHKHIQKLDVIVSLYNR